MSKNSYVYVERATAREKAIMQEWIDGENQFQQQEPQGWDDDSCSEFPITFKLEKHRAYQMQAYDPQGQMMDNSYHQIFIRCGNCGAIEITSGDGDDGYLCTSCFSNLTDYGRY